MNLSGVLRPLRLFTSSRRNHSNDPEKGPNQEEKQEDETHENAAQAPQEDTEEPEADAQDSDDTETDEDTSSTEIQSDTSQEEKPAPFLSRIKSFLFPKEDPRAHEHYVPNYRYTPIISGIVIPFSILLEIPGLTERWYIRHLPDGTVETRRNTVLLDTALGFSLASGLIANIAIIIRFLEKRVKLSTQVCIISLTLHDILNIVVVTIFGVQHRHDDGFTYGESFWMTVCSTGASTITNVFLLIDYVKTPDFKKSGSGLTRKQRSLVIIVIVLLIYIAFGALINSVIQDFTFINSLYFTVVSIETIGFGDVVPENTGARIFICCYMAFGILNIGIAIAMCRETILEALEMGYRQRIRKLRLRRREARRYRRWEERWKRAVEWRLNEKGLPVWVPDQDGGERIRFVGLKRTRSKLSEGYELRKWLETIGLLEPHEDKRQSVPGHPKGYHLNIEALSSQELESTALEAGVPLELFLKPVHSRRRRRDEENVSERQRFGPPVTGQGRRRWPWANVWPSQPQTPTHAQLGRMAIMLTKFSFAVSGFTGTYIRAVERTTEEEDSSLRYKPISHQDAEHKQGVDVSLERRDGPVRSEQDGGSSRGEPGGEERKFAMSRIHQPSTRGVRPQPLKWARQLTRGSIQKAALSSEGWAEEMDVQEKRARYVQITMAWLLFLLFWMIGALSYKFTEGWTYGIALYFCFVTFTTTGYGDFAPSTPAGRSVFVVWALLGVGTMTILISVLTEAGHSKYKSALHVRTFDHAVEKYRRRIQKEGNIFASELNVSRVKHPSQHEASPEAVEHKKQKARQALEQLPEDIIRHARKFHDHLHYFISHGPQSIDQALASEEGGSTSLLRQELKELLDHIAEVGHLSPKAKKEIMQDEEAKKTLFMLNIERVLREMINAAERALAALAERDKLLAAQATRQSDQSHAPSEGNLSVPPRSTVPEGHDPSNADVSTSHSKRSH